MEDCALLLCDYEPGKGVTDASDESSGDGCGGPERRGCASGLQGPGRGMGKVKKLARFVGDNGLSIVFIVLFLICLAGQALTGVRLENGVRGLHGQGALRLWEYVGTGSFLQGVFSNWQAAILQLGALIFFGTYLHQKGAPHSKKRGRAGTKHAEHGKPGEGADEAGAEVEAGKKDGEHAGWWKCNSLSVTFFGLFVVVFVLHFFSGWYAYAEQRAYDQQAALSASAFLLSAKFWFSTLQTWEAEFMAIALYVLLSIFLRQQGSPESKPVDSGDDDTGDPNE